MKAKKILAMIEELREAGGKVVIAFFHKDGWEWPSCQITVKGVWTGDDERQFAGKTIDGPLLLAVTAKRAALELEPKAEPLPFRGPWKLHLNRGGRSGGQAILNATNEVLTAWVRDDISPLVLAAPELLLTCQTLLQLDEFEGSVRNDAVIAAEELLKRISPDVAKPESE